MAPALLTRGVNVGLYSGISAVRASERRLEAIASNLANVDTPGYKRRATRNFSIELGDARRSRKQVVSAQRIDFSQGNLERTGNPLDLALMGPGFFAVEGKSGEIYTRRGELLSDANGTLTTQEGYPVAWTRGPGRIDPVGLPLTVDEAGVMRQGAVDVGQLKLVDFPALDQLRLDSEGYFRAPVSLDRTEATAEVHQFARERSNVSSVDELVALISTQRSFESATRLMQMLDDSYKRLNRDN